MPDAQDLVLEFRLHVGDELLVETGVRRIGKLELEHQRDAQFIAGVEERVVLVESAAPEPDEVEVARRRVLHIRAQHLGRDPRQQIVGGDHIRSLGEKRLPVNLQRISASACPGMVSNCRSPIRFLIVSSTVPLASSNCTSTV